MSASAITAAERHNVHVHGPADAPPMLFIHGFGCDQNMWRFVWPQFADDFRVILFDHVGHGGADRSAFDAEHHSTLDGYASDVLDVCHELDLTDITFVGHSVSAMIGALAAIREPQRFARLVMIGPSARYIDDDGYAGGFTRPDIDGLLESLDSNFLGWSAAMAPVIMGNPDRDELGEELRASFCATDPAIAQQFARVTFLSDNRDDLARVATPTLILQCADDAIAPTAVGEFVHAQLPDSELVYLRATGHCPNLSAPEETTAAIRAFLAS
jgi:sigma-B regulation protein RsbQ